MTEINRSWRVLLILLLITLHPMGASLLSAQAECNAPEGTLCVVPPTFGDEMTQMMAGGGDEEGGMFPQTVFLRLSWQGDGYLGTGVKISSDGSTATYLFTALSLSGNGTISGGFRMTLGEALLYYITGVANIGYYWVDLRSGGGSGLGD